MDEPFDPPAELIEEGIRVGDVELAILRPADTDGLFVEAFLSHDERMPYWTDLWPAGRALARALPDSLDGVRIVEIGCGLGLPSLVAAARGAHVTSIDYAPGAVELLRQNAKRNGLELQAQRADWETVAGPFELALAADVLYDQRNVEPLLGLLPRLAPRVLLADSAPVPRVAADFLLRAAKTWMIDELSDGVFELRAARPTLLTAAVQRVDRST